MPVKKYKQCGIYCYHNIVNGKNYVGQSIDLKARKRQFGNKNKKYSGIIFQNAIKKYGKKNFQYSILTHCKPEELNYYEEFYISRLKTTDRRYGYNCTSGGDSQFFRTDDTKKRMREVWTNERRKEKSEQQTGKNNYFFGHNHSEEAREKMKKMATERYKSNFLKKHGCSLSELEEKMKEYVEKNQYSTYADIMREFKISYRTMMNVREKIGYDSEFAIQKKRDKERKVIVQCDRENHSIVLNYFRSISLAKEITGIKSINGCLNGSFSHAGGYFWRFLNENETPCYGLNEKYLKPTETANKLDEKTKQRMKERGVWNHENLQKRVFKYDSNGRLIQKYDSVSLGKEDGFNPCDISNCCRGKVKTLYGYVFSYNELTSEEVKERFIKNNIKKVIQLTKEGEYIREWESATEAAKTLGLSTMSNINSCCHGKAKSAAGYRWMFKDN